MVRPLLRGTPGGPDEGSYLAQLSTTCHLTLVRNDQPTVEAWFHPPGSLESRAGGPLFMCKEARRLAGICLPAFLWICLSPLQSSGGS